MQQKNKRLHESRPSAYKRSKDHQRHAEQTISRDLEKKLDTAQDKSTWKVLKQAFMHVIMII